MFRVNVSPAWVALLASSLCTFASADEYRFWMLAGKERAIPRPRKLVAVENGKVTLEHEDDQAREQFPLRDFVESDQRLIRLWQDDAKRAGVERALKLGDLTLADSGAVEIRIGNWRVTDDDVKLFVRSFPELTLLHLSHCAISHEGMKAIATLPQLRSLEIPMASGKHSGVTNIEVNLSGKQTEPSTEDFDPGFEIVASIKTLESLEFHGNGSQSIGKHFSALAKSNIKKLTLSFARLTAEDLERIAAIPNLEEFSPNISPISTDVQPPLLKHLRGMKKLRVLDLSGVELTDEDAQHLTAFPALESLDIAGCTPAGLAQLPKLRKLQSLRVIGFEPNLDDDSLATIGKLTQLKTLWLRSDEITDAGLAHLAELVELESLSLPASINGPGLAHLAKLAKLKRLKLDSAIGFQSQPPVVMSHALRLLVDMQGRPVQEALHVLSDDVPATGPIKSLTSLDPPIDLTSVKYLTSLDIEELDLEYAPLDAWLKAFSLCRSVRRLRLYGNLSGQRGEKDTQLPVSAAGLKHLAAWDQLERLDIHECEIGPAALVPIRNLPKLRSLSLNFSNLGRDNMTVLAALTKLEHLDLNGIDLTPADVESLAGHTALRELTFTTPVPVESLRSLKGLEKLKRLEFPWARVPFDDLWQLLTVEFRRPPEEAVKLVFDVQLDTQAHVQVLNLHDLSDLNARSPKRSTAELDRTAAMIEHLTHLRRLELPIGVSNKALAHLKHTPRLNWLEITSPEVTDEGLAHLLTLKELERVNLWMAPVTEKGLQTLVKLPAIKFIVLSSSQTDKATAERYEKAHPRISIIIH